MKLFTIIVAFILLFVLASATSNNVELRKKAQHQLEARELEKNSDEKKANRRVSRDKENRSSQFSSSSSNDDDDDDGLADWEIGLIAGGCAAFCLLLLLLLLLIGFTAGRSHDKYETKVHRNENVA